MLTKEHFVNAYEFHQPRLFYDKASDALRRRLPDSLLWSIPDRTWGRHMRPIRELWEISNFTIGFSLLRNQTVEVRLSEEEPADGQIKFAGRLIDLQTTVRNREGRQPGRAYHNQDKYLELLRKDDVECSLEQSTQWITEAVESKVYKSYAKQRPLWLLVYANFEKRGLDFDALISSVGALHQRSFDSIWLLSRIHSPATRDNPAFAIASLYPPETEPLFYEYEPTAERVIKPEELCCPFGPVEISAGKPV